jgi:tRNA A-37 threonylcarbamoyl transferase component Bud32
MDALGLVQADENFYLPVDRVIERGTTYRPADVPPGWQGTDRDVWTSWRPPGERRLAEAGWKVHVSSPFDRAQEVLDRAAAVFFAEGVAFKHLSCSRFYLLAHHKHGHRPQSGKFCAAYPADVAAARRLMDALDAELGDEPGPSVLSDRRYRKSTSVYYRYGAFVPRSRVRLDGSMEFLVRDGAGAEVADRRLGKFVLPEGVSDPFEDETRLDDYTPVPAGFQPTLHGYRIDRAIAATNSGGAYAGTEVATGRPVFVKEARVHNGYTASGSDAHQRLRAEHAALRAIHDHHPGLCPRPVDQFRVWTNEYLVTEYVPGVPLRRWIVANNPLIWAERSPADFAAYYARCQAILAAVADALERLHGAGYAFIDLSPSNVLVADDDSVRLIDFEAVVPLDTDQPCELLGTPGHAPPRRTVFADRRDYDDYGLAMLALYLLAPLNETAQRNPAVLGHLRGVLAREADVPVGLWAAATRFHRAAAYDFLRTPGPREVAAEPDDHLAALRRSLLDGLLEAADDKGFALGPGRYATNDLCVAHGTAGVIHALSYADEPVPDGAVDRLVAEALARSESLPPGLYSGLAGIAWVLAGADRPAEAAKLLEAADAHRLLAHGPDSATLGHGRAGVGLAHLALFHRTGDAEHLDRALAQAAAIPRGDAVAAVLGPDNATGLSNGPSGVAHLYHHLWRVTRDDTLLDEGVRLLHRDLDRMRSDHGGLLLPVSDTDGRIMPYLDRGTGGVAFAASRYLADRPDARLAAAMPAMLGSLTCPYTIYSGLFAGMAGLGLVLADHGARHGDTGALDEADLLARRLFLYAVPHGRGAHVLGEHLLRYSTDLMFGSAGVVVFLHFLAHRRPDPFLTLDTFDTARTEGR